MTGPEQNETGLSGHRRRALLIISVAVVAVTAIAFLRRAGVHPDYRLDVTVMFANGNSLREGAPVRIAGVEVGRVRSVRVRPYAQDHPVQAELEFRTPYELQIPRKAAVTLETEGILGETLVEFDLKGATGPSLQNGDVVISNYAPSLDSAVAWQLMEQLVTNAVRQQPQTTGPSIKNKPR